MKKFNACISLILAVIMMAIILPACTSSEPPASPAAKTPEATEAAEITAEPASARPIEETEAPAETEKPNPAADARVLAVFEPSVLEFDPSSYDLGFPVTEYVDGSMAGEEMTFEFAGKQYDLVYTSTFNLLYRSSVFCDYELKQPNEIKDSTFRFLPDGTPVSMLMIDSAFVTVDIDENADVDSVRAAVEDTLRDELDFDRYECFKLTKDEFETYELFYYNELDGIQMADWLEISVSKDGRVYSITMNYNIDFGFGSLPEELNFEDYLPSLEARIKKLYGSKYAGYTIKRTELTAVEGTPCIYCYVLVDYFTRMSKTGTMEEYCELAIMLDP